MVLCEITVDNVSILFVIGIMRSRLFRHRKLIKDRATSWRRAVVLSALVIYKHLCSRGRALDSLYALKRPPKNTNTHTVGAEDDGQDRRRRRITAGVVELS